MNKKEIIENLYSVILKYDKYVSELKDDMKIEDVKIDELSKVQIVMEVERIFDVEFDIGNMHNIKTVGEIAEFIENRKQREKDV